MLESNALITGDPMWKQLAAEWLRANRLLGGSPAFTDLANLGLRTHANYSDVSKVCSIAEAVSTSEGAIERTIRIAGRRPTLNEVDVIILGKWEVAGERVGVHLGDRWSGGSEAD